MKNLNPGTGKSGYTLLEVILVLTLLSIILPLIYGLHTSVMKWLSFNKQQLDLQQRRRSLSVYLEEKIKEAVAVKIEDVDGDGEKDLFLNLGNGAGAKDETDEATDFYVLFNVEEGELNRRRLKGSSEDCGISYPAWPGDDLLSYNYSVMMPIIKDHHFSLTEAGAVTYSFIIELEGEKIKLENKVSPYYLRGG